MTKVVDPSLLAELNSQVTDPALLDQLNAGGGTSDAAVETAAWGQKIKSELKDSGGIWANVGAGANKTLQGVKQIFGQGGTVESIKERRKLDDQLAEGQTGGGALQLGGEMLASALPSMGVGAAVGKGLTMLPKVGSKIAALAGRGGRIATVGAVGRGAVEGATGAVLNETLPGESDALNAGIGAVAGAVAPALVNTVGAGARLVRNKYAGNRAASMFEKHLGDDATHDVNFRLGADEPTKLPLSTAALSENTKLAALERGARGRVDPYSHDKAVADESWRLIKGATSSADELPARIEGREAMMRMSKEDMGQQVDPAKLDSGRREVGATLNKLRDTSAARQNPELYKVFSDTEMSLANPKATGEDFQSLYWRLLDKADNPGLTPEMRGSIKQLAESVKRGGDKSAGDHRLSDMLERYKVENKLVQQSEADKGIRNQFMDDRGAVAQAVRSIHGTPEITSARLRGAVSSHGSNKYEDLLTPTNRTQLSGLESELGRHELWKGSNSPGATGLDLFNPLPAVSSGYGNPFRVIPGLKGLGETVLQRSRDSTTKVADEALMNPEVWKKMMAEYAHSNSPLTPKEYGRQTLRQLMMTPGRATAAALGE